MELELKGKKVLITGGSKGIGLACARSFIAEEAKRLSRVIKTKGITAD